MIPLLELIDEITKYGLIPNLTDEDKEQSLETSLVKLYSEYLNTKDIFESAEYPNVDDSVQSDILSNVSSNFPQFGLYHEVINPGDISNDPKLAMGDAIDDLSDIIIDLLGVKSRIENNSLEDGLWYFKFIFYSHTQNHLLGLLKYLKEKKG